MVSAALLALACALACLPRRVVADRLTTLWPLRARARRPWRRLGGPVAVGAVGGLARARGRAERWPGAARDSHRGPRRRARARPADAAPRPPSSPTPCAASPTSCGREAIRRPRSPGLAADGPVAARLLGPAATAARLGDDVPAALRRGAHAGSVPPPSWDGWPQPGRSPNGTAFRSPTCSPESTTTSAGGSGSAQGVRAQLAGPRATAGVLTALPGARRGAGPAASAPIRSACCAAVCSARFCWSSVSGWSPPGRAWTEQILRLAVPR